MITKFKARNFMGIEKEIVINCLANNKIKRKYVPFVSDDDGVNILRSIGVIGGNGSGKTSIANALRTIQTFVNFPFRKSDPKNQQMMDTLKEVTTKELLEQILLNMNTLSLPSANVNHSQEDVRLSIEMFIPDNTYQVSGYYTYSLTYDYTYKKTGVKEEKLEYRKKYNSKKTSNIFCVNNIIESELGTKILYENNTINSDKKLLPYYKTFIAEIGKMESVFNADDFDIKEFYNNHERVFSNLCNLADEKIIGVQIEKKENSEELIFLNKNNKKLYFFQLSEGTKKILVVGSRIIDSIEKNKILIIDEIEKSLHPSLSSLLVSLVQKNTKKAYNQLFFTTHSIYLAMELDNDQLYYIDNKNDDYVFQNINDAIRKNVITKDKVITTAIVDNLLINNPNKKKICEFISDFN